MATTKTAVKKSLYISETKFLILNVVTLGLYSVYWGWQAWEVVRRTDNQVYKFKSSLRALFLPISGLRLFPNLTKKASSVDKTYTSSGLVVAVNYLAFVLIAYLLSVYDQYALSNQFFVPILLATAAIEAYILLPIVRAFNIYLQKTSKKFDRPTQKNIGLLFFLIIFGLFGALSIAESYIQIPG